MWTVNVLAHLYAARAVVPRMLERGGGYLLSTASAAGLLSQPGDAPYSVTKHAAVALAEWLAITYGDQGIKVSCLCPMAVATAMLGRRADATARPRLPTAARGGGGGRGAGILPPEQVADAVVEGLRDERFLILPHPEVATFEQRRAADRDRWLAGMRRLNTTLAAGIRRPTPSAPTWPATRRTGRRHRRPTPGWPPSASWPATGCAGATVQGRVGARGGSRGRERDGSVGGAGRARGQPGAASRAARGGAPGPPGRGDVGAGAPTGPPAPSSSGCGAVRRVVRPRAHGERTDDRCV